MLIYLEYLLFRHESWELALGLNVLVVVLFSVVALTLQLVGAFERPVIEAKAEVQS